MAQYLLLAAAIAAVCVLIILLRRPELMRKLCISCCGGVAVLIVVNLTAGLTGVALAVSGKSLAVAAVLGLPGVVSMLVLKLIWQIH